MIIFVFKIFCILFFVVVVAYVTAFSILLRYQPFFSADLFY